MSTDTQKPGTHINRDVERDLDDLIHALYPGLRVSVVMYDHEGGPFSIAKNGDEVAFVSYYFYSETVPEDRHSVRHILAAHMPGGSPEIVFGPGGADVTLDDVFYETSEHGLHDAAETVRSGK